MAEESLSGFVARRADDPAQLSVVEPVLRAGSRDFGPIAHHVSDPAVTDIFINGFQNLWIDRGSGLVRDDHWSCPSESHLRQLATRLVSLGGRHIDETNPCVDVRLHDGIRLHVILPPVAREGTLVSVRIPPVSKLHLDDLIHNGLLGNGSDRAEKHVFLQNIVASRENILVTGASGSGKTTLLAALLGLAASNERIVAIEDVAELRVEHPHFLALEARQANREGAGEITLARLVREALRMRPDRLVLGECRGSEIREMLAALNTGHDGGASTLHANSLRDVPARIEALAALAGLGPEAIARQVISAIGYVLHLERKGAVRMLTEIGRFGLDQRSRLVMMAVGCHSPTDSSPARHAEPIRT